MGLYTLPKPEKGTLLNKVRSPNRLVGLRALLVCCCCCCCCCDDDDDEVAGGGSGCCCCCFCITSWWGNKDRANEGFIRAEGGAGGVGPLLECEADELPDVVDSASILAAVVLVTPAGLLVIRDESNCERKPRLQVRVRV